MERVVSADGTSIAFERRGEGDPVLLLPGALCTRGVLLPLASALAEAGVPAVSVDRRGRGDSDDRGPGPPWDVLREVEDIRAVVDALGGVRAIYGHSSGAGVALHAVAAGVDVERLVLHDAPWTPAKEPSDGPDWSARLTELIEDGRPGDAVETFLRMIGVPAEVVSGMRRGEEWQAFEAVGPSLGYDSAAMGDADGGYVPHDLLASIAVPTLMLAGGADHPFMRDVAREAHAVLSQGSLTLLDGAGHDASPEVVVPALLPFLAQG